MPVRNSVVAGVLIAGTFATAAGLNLAVMGLDRTDAGGADSAEPAETVAPIDGQVELTSAEIAPVDQAPAPVLTVGLSTPSGDPVSPDTVAPQPAEAVAVTPSSTDLAPTTAPELPPSTAGPSSVSPPPPSPVATDASTSTAPTPRAPTAPPQPSTQPPASPATTAPSPPPTEPVSTEYKTYEFEGIASIIIAVHDERELEFWSISAEHGWAFLVDDRGPDKVKIKFRPKNGGDEAEFEAKFDGERLKVKREY